MATLDISLISFLTPVFVFLFIFVFIYALLNKTNLIDEKHQALKFLAAVSIAAVSVFVGDLIKLFATVTPWIVFIIVILAIVFAMYSWLGVENKVIWDTVGGHITIMVIILIILLIGLVVVFEPQLTPFDATSTANGQISAGRSIQSEVIYFTFNPSCLCFWNGL